MSRKVQADEAQQMILRSQAMYRRAELLQLRAQAERSEVQALKDELQQKMQAQADLEQRLLDQQAEADEERRRLERLHMLLLENTAKLKEDLEVNREVIERAQQEVAASEQIAHERQLLLDRLAALRSHILSPTLCTQESDVPPELDLACLTTAATYDGPDCVNVDRTVCRGSLCKLGRFHKVWLNRWFVLSLVTKKLTYFTSDDERTRKGVIELADVIGVVQQYSTDESLTCFHIMTPLRTYHLRTTNATSVRVWMDVLRAMVAM